MSELRREWRLLRALSAMLAVLLLSACGGSAPVSPEENRSGVVEFVKESAAVVPGEGWSTNEGTPPADRCGLGWGRRGARFAYNYWARPGVDLEGDAQRVAEYWRSLGMSVRVTDSTPWPTVYGEGGPVQRASFATSSAWADRYSIGAVSWCEPGDWMALNRDFRRRAQEGEVQPGDEPRMSEEEQAWTPARLHRRPRPRPLPRRSHGAP
ncbi:hypothetical protein, partial [Rathayibacter tanaceti]|uniref:hypothetical protein n=1 Tax=Rathayibacter tanaceti TaxID=1671680 RepID=UPI000A8334A1